MILIEMLEDIDNYPELKKYYSLLTSDEKKKFLNGIKTLKRDVFNEDIIFNGQVIRRKLSYFHGIYHAEKVCLFSVILGHLLGCDAFDIDVLIDSSRYHDFMRTNDGEDKIHGFVAAKDIDKVIDVDNYLPVKTQIIKCLIDFHSDQNRFEDKMIDYGINSIYTERVKKLCYILADADSLDRERFITPCDAKLDPTFLYCEESKKLINLSDEINRKYYLEYYKCHKDELLSLTKFSSPFFHGIGCNPLRLRSILQNGVLCHYEIFKRKKPFNRNFKGNNKEEWISVIPTTRLNEGKASKEFLSHGIILVGNTRDLYDGVFEKTDKLPQRKEAYPDEAFAYNNISIDDISSIIVNKGDALENICHLTNFVYNSFDYKFYKNNVKFYVDRLKIKKKDISKLLKEYKKILDEYNKLDDQLKRALEVDFANELINVNNKVNFLIALAMQNYYTKEINDGSDPTLVNSVIHELKMAHIDYDLTYGDEILFSLQPKKKINRKN